MKFCNRILSLLFCLLLVSACSPTENTEYLPGVDMPLSQMNGDVQVFAPPGWNSYKTTDPIFLDVLVRNENIVVFQSDFSVRVFLEQKDRWVEIEHVSPSLDGLVYISADTTPGELCSLVVQPILPNFEEPARVRVVIFGKITQNNLVTDELVGAYVDLNLRP